MLRTTSAIHLVLTALAAALLQTLASAQGWRDEDIADIGLQIDAPGRLERLPMQLGQNKLYHRARLRPKDDADFVRAQYYWYCDVYEFPKGEPEKDASGEIKLPDGVPEELKAELRKLLSSGSKRHDSFQSWLEDQEDDEEKVIIRTKDKKKRGKNGRLDYKHWVWTVASGFGPVGIVYCEAAVYEFEDRELALVIEMPLETERPGKPKSKWSNIIKRMIASGRALDPEKLAGKGPDKRDKFADTPERKKALAAAKANIQGLKGWDYFTAPNYIVVYSWDFERPDERSSSLRSAEFYSERLEKMRQLYVDYYPLDESGTKAIMPDPSSIPGEGPVTGARDEETADEEASDDEPGEARPVPYPVFRLCATYDQFRKYGQSPPGVVGWFSPASKELVVFLGGDQMMGKGATETVTYHEGWHQYADLYFNHPDTPNPTSLHRWFDEGHGDFFGSFRWGMNGWKYVGSDMRYSAVKNMVRAGDHVPFKDIVKWPRRIFYGPKAAYYYAQAFSMIDFMRRGEKLRSHWQPRYGEILDTYRRVKLLKGKADLASDLAFKGWTDEDWATMEAAWKAWVDSQYFLDGN